MIREYGSDSENANLQMLVPPKLLQEGHFVLYFLEHFEVLKAESNQEENKALKPFAPANVL